MDRCSAKLKMRILLLTVIVLAVTVFTAPAIASSHLSAEPVPNENVVGAANLAKILNIGYSNLETWSNRLLNECRVVDNVIGVLTTNGAVNTINRGNTSFSVAAGGFEAVTNPSFVFNISDSGQNAASGADVEVLSNALGYVLSQGGTAHFSPDNPKAYFFPLDYAVVSFARGLTGLEAKAFFDYLGTIDPALWSGQFAGFTQLGNTMFFLQPATNKQQFIRGLSTAAGTYPWATYVTLNNNGQPTTAKAGISFPENDWAAFPGGDQYLTRLGNASPQLLSDLAALRGRHLEAVCELLKAFDKGSVATYLQHQFRCPR